MLTQNSISQPQPAPRAAPLGWLSRSIGAQFSAVTILLALVPVLLVAGALAWFSVSQAGQALQAARLDQLTALRHERATALTGYFTELQNDVNSLVDTVAFLRQDAIAKLSAVNRNKTDALVRLFNVWQADVKDVSSDPDVVRGTVELSAGFKALGAAQARALYGDKGLLTDAGDGSAYSAEHQRQHSFFAGYTDIHGYPDALLIDLDGNVVYTTRKSDVFGTNLASGEYKDSGLAGLYKALKKSFPGQTYIADAAKLGDEFAMFVGAPVYSGTLQVGILAYRLPLTAINEIVQERAGLKPSTESFLIAQVGDRYFYRSDRIVKKGKIGDPRPDVAYNAPAMAGAGSMIALGSTGVYEVAVFNPLPLPGLKWAILTTGNAKENFVPRVEGSPDDFYTGYAKTRGYHDLFLIQPDGFVFYSVAKEADYETNLLTGPYKDTNLGRLVARVLRDKKYAMADYAFYEPSGGKPAAFVAQPLIQDGQVQLIIAIQVPNEQIEKIVADYTGLGETGETPLVGPDRLARSSLRNVENAQLRTKIDTIGINSALQGNASSGLVLDYRGIPVFAAWQPIELPGTDIRWAIAAKIDQAEALRPVNDLQRVIVGVSLGLALLAALAAVISASILARRLVRPIASLTQIAQEITAGNFDVDLPHLERADEVGILTNAFATMARRVRELIHSLDARTKQLEANQRAIQVVFSAGSAVKTDELLGLIVNLIRDRFNLYHVQIYLLDDKQENAVLRQSTGFAGQQLLARKHRIPMERTALVTKCIKEARPVLVADTRADPNFLPNPLLPDTRSELVVPLKVNEQVIGALDAQHRETGFFTEDMVTLFETLVEQVGLLFQNAQLFTSVAEQTERLNAFTAQLSTAAEVAQRLSTILDPEYLLNETVELIKSRFGFYHVHVYLLEQDLTGLEDPSGLLVVRAGSGEVGRVLKERKHSIPLDHEKSLVARAAREKVTQMVRDTALQSDFMPNPLLPQTRSELAVPLLAGDRVLGVLDIQDDQPERFGIAERDTFTTLAGQIATALQNAQSFAAQKKAEEALRQLSRQNQLVLDSAAEGIYGTDNQGIITFANPAAAQILGWSVQELLGRHNHDLFHHHYPDGRAYPKEECPIRQAYADAVVHQGEEYFWRKNGEGFPVEYTSTPVIEEGKVIGAVITFRDITQRKRAEAEIAKRAADLQTVAEVSTIVSTILEPDRLLQEVVDLTKARFNLYHAHIYLLEEPSPEQLLEADSAQIGRLMSERNLVLRAGAGEVGRQMVAQGWKIPLNREHSLVARAARERQGLIVNDVRAEPDFMPNPLLPNTRAEMAVPLILGDRVLGVLDVQSDQVGHFTPDDVVIMNTLARQIATALENARLFEESKHTQERLREVDRLKSEFLASMSHELRTPLNSIIGFSEVILMGAAQEMDPETREDIQAIYDNGHHLLNLINDILDLAKIEAGRMILTMEDVDVADLLEQVKTNNIGLLHKSKKPVELEVAVEDALPPVRADRLRLSQVLNNLVSNAVKFTDRGRIDLRAYSDNGQVCIQVQDTGIGISPADMPKLFGKFRQLDGSNKRRAEGTGLGLAITKHLVEMHGGTIEVQSKVGEGSTFTVRLPIGGALPAQTEAHE